VRRLMPFVTDNNQAIGRRFRFDPNGPLMRIVGVAHDAEI